MSSLIVVGVFELAREIHRLEPADRVVVMQLVQDLQRAQQPVSQSGASRNPSHAAALPLTSPPTLLSLP